MSAVLDAFGKPCRAQSGGHCSLRKTAAGLYAEEAKEVEHGHQIVTGAQRVAVQRLGYGLQLCRDQRGPKRRARPAGPRRVNLWRGILSHWKAPARHGLAAAGAGRTPHFDGHAGRPAANADIAKRTAAGGVTPRRYRALSSGVRPSESAQLYRSAHSRNEGSSFPTAVTR